MIENMTTELTMLGTGNAVSRLRPERTSYWSTPEVATVYWDSWRKRESR